MPNEAPIKVPTSPVRESTFPRDLITRLVLVSGEEFRFHDVFFLLYRTNACGLQSRHVDQIYYSTFKPERAYQLNQ